LVFVKKPVQESRVLYIGTDKLQVEEKKADNDNKKKGPENKGRGLFRRRIGFSFSGGGHRSIIREIKLGVNVPGVSASQTGAI
jgi:hypothetical protein